MFSHKILIALIPCALLMSSFGAKAIDNALPPGIYTTSVGTALWKPIGRHVADLVKDIRYFEAKLVRRVSSDTADRMVKRADELQDFQYKIHQDQVNKPQTP